MIFRDDGYNNNSKSIPKVIWCLNGRCMATQKISILQGQGLKLRRIEPCLIEQFSTSFIGSCRFVSQKTYPNSNKLRLLFIRVWWRLFSILDPQTRMSFRPAIFCFRNLVQTPTPPTITSLSTHYLNIHPLSHCWHYWNHIQHCHPLAWRELQIRKIQQCNVAW